MGMCLIKLTSSPGVHVQKRFLRKTFVGRIDPFSGALLPPSMLSGTGIHGPLQRVYVQLMRPKKMYLWEVLAMAGQAKAS